MSKKIAVKMGVALVAALLAAVTIVGCGPGAAVVANEEQQANRAYMSQVNQTMEKLRADLASFVDAVSRGDVVNMRTQADNAYKTLDALDALEVPEDMQDIQQNYVDGSAKLREALDGYIALYTDINNADFDWSTYDTRIAAIQALYDEGAAALEAGDEVAASKS